MKSFKLVFLCLLLILVGIGCSTSEKKSSNMMKKEAGGEVVRDSFRIKPSGSHEECIELRPGMVFDYEYDASDSVNFNIHYHAEDGIHYPVDKKGMSFGKGMIDPTTHDFYTEEQEYYCLMWDNVSLEPVDVSFKCVLSQMHKGGRMMQH